MKHKIFYFFLIFIVAGTLCSSEFLKELREEVQREMRMHILREKIRDKDLISFTQKQLKDVEWLSKNEFKFNGELYDIVKVIDNKFYCIKDPKETKIRRFEESSLPLFSLILGHQKCFSSKTKTVKSQKQLFSPGFQENIKIGEYNLLVKNYHYFLKSGTYFHLKIFSPPKFYTMI